jgi:hypothetical protein
LHKFLKIIKIKTISLNFIRIEYITKLNSIIEYRNE